MAVAVPAGPGGWEMPLNFHAHGIKWSSGIASDRSGCPKIPWEFFVGEIPSSSALAAPKIPHPWLGAHGFGHLHVDPSLLEGSVAVPGSLAGHTRGGSSIPSACSSPSLPAKPRASISLLIALIRERGGVNWKTLGSCLFAGGMDVNKPGLMTGTARAPRRLAASRGMSRKCYCSDEAIVN